ncbi:MAG: hypothetical protein LIP01_10005, partial [Tannerellaceae bacterium]|nr:hypothetical protein [Tannerellaceae bacterium]
VFVVVASANPALGELSGNTLSDMYDLINSYQLNNTNYRIIPPGYIPMAGEASVTVGVMNMEFRLL